MKIGIVTIIDNNNYGNRLQNYAVQKVIKDTLPDSEVITFLNEPYSNTKKHYILRQIKNINNKGTYSSNVNRSYNFKKFNENITFSDKKITAYTKYKDYDFIVVGSDQVWNPVISRMRNVDLLSNVAPDRRIALSASFSIDNLPDSSKDDARKELAKFKKISVREDRGKTIVEELVDRKDVEVLIDPTMALTSSDWDFVAKKPKMLKTDKFILNYFLGDLSKKRRSAIEKVAKENDCEIIDILDKNGPFFECGPSEFLYLEKNAFLICTDSFHSCVFSIIYNRPFVVFDREQKGVVNMGSRINTLLSKFKLSNRRYNEKELTKENLLCDYKLANKILKSERIKMQKFVADAFEVKK